MYSAKLPGRQAGDMVEALDDVGLPERLAAIERARMDARDLDAELAPVAGLRQRDVTHVELDVDVGSPRSSTAGRGPAAR